MPNHVNVSEAREQIHAIVEEARAGNETVITKYRKPFAVVIGIDQYRQLREAAG